MDDKSNDHLNLEEFNYVLPEELIAQELENPRDNARLMIVNKTHNDNSHIEHKRFFELVDYLQKDDVLVMNSTRVMHAKICGHKDTGSSAEVVLLKKISDNLWECRIKTKNPNPGTMIIFPKGSGKIISKLAEDIFTIELDSENILDDAILPTPPYIKRKIGDDEYQTVYAKEEGSLAAPTAGLHFTNELIKKIEKKGVKIVYITLHVSYGTFKKIDHGIDKYVMDPEYYSITSGAANIINSRKGRLIVVGTTTLKALESSSKNGLIIPKSGYSKLFIVPGHKFNSKIDILITNLHLPKSTLLLLTSAFAGKITVLNAYNLAIAEKYRFFSLGDAMLLFNSNK